MDPFRKMFVIEQEGLYKDKGLIKLQVNLSIRFIPT